MNESINLKDIDKEYKAEVVNAIRYSVKNFYEINTGKFLIPNSDIYGVKIIYNPEDDFGCYIHEVHRKRVDIHVLIEGNELVNLILNTNLDDVSEVISQYDDENDYSLARMDHLDLRYLAEGTCFAISCGAYHKAGLKYDCVQVSKFVLKVPEYYFFECPILI